MRALLILLFAISLQAQTLVSNRGGSSGDGGAECTVGMDTIASGYSEFINGIGRNNTYAYVFGVFTYDGTTISSGETICIENDFQVSGTLEFDKVVLAISPDSSGVTEPKLELMSNWSDTVDVSGVSTTSRDTVTFTNITITSDLTNGSDYWLVWKPNGYDSDGDAYVRVGAGDDTGTERFLKASTLYGSKTQISDTKSPMTRILD